MAADAWLSGVERRLIVYMPKHLAPLADPAAASPHELPSLPISAEPMAALTFGDLLAKAGLDPADVRLLRHQDPSADPGRTPFELWRTDPDAFLAYQARQSLRRAVQLERARHWAAFVETPAGETLFAGLYRATSRGVATEDRPMVHRARDVDRAGEYALFGLEPLDTLKAFAGRLVVDWGRKDQNWVQRAERNVKPILELRRAYEEPRFPDFADLAFPLSSVRTLPTSWAVALSATRGIYVLTCPRTRELYVGSATGEAGFLGRWREYCETGHGGNVRLKSREPSDYQVAVLEVAGSEQGLAEILRAEQRWMRKLNTVSMGLNS